MPTCQTTKTNPLRTIAEVSVDDETDEELSIDQLTERAHEAIQALITATYGPMVVRKFLGYAEVVDDEDDQPMLFMFRSRHLAPWDCSGMAHFGMHLVEDIMDC